jgi:hypothetical protein
MGTGSERVNAVLTEITLPRGACPLFQRHLGMVRRKMGTGTVAEDVFALFSARSDGASPHFPATVFSV